MKEKGYWNWLFGNTKYLFEFITTDLLPMILFVVFSLIYWYVISAFLKQFGYTYFTRTVFAPLFCLWILLSFFLITYLIYKEYHIEKEDEK